MALLALLFRCVNDSGDVPKTAVNEQHGKEDADALTFHA